MAADYTARFTATYSQLTISPSTLSLPSTQCQTLRTFNLRSQVQSTVLGFINLFPLLHLQCLASTTLPTLAGADVSRLKLRCLLFHGPPEAQDAAVQDAVVLVAMAKVFSRWETREGQSLSIMVLLPLAVTFTKAKAVVMADLQVLP